MKKLLALLICLTVIMGIFSGCSPSGNTPPDASSNQSGTPPEEKVTISFMDMIPGPAREAFFTEMINGFQQEYPNITVEYESVPYDDAYQKLTILGASESLPDVVNLLDTWKNEFVTAGWLESLQGYLPKLSSGDKLAKTVTGIQWKQEIDRFGEVYTMPDALMTNGIFVRKDWLAEAGYDYDELVKNWTWDDYFEINEKLTSKEKNRYGNSFRGGPGGINIYQFYLTSFTGGYIYDKDGNCLLYSPENVKRLDRYLDIYRKGQAPKDSINWGFAEMVDNFSGGLTATLLNDTDVAAVCNERMEKDQWGVLPMPRSTVDNKIYSYIGSAYNYGIAKTSEHKDAAWKFIEYVSRPENNIKYCEAMAMMPLYSDVPMGDFFGADGPVSGFIAQLNDADFAYAQWKNPVDVGDIVQQSGVAMFQQVLQGTKSTEDALKEWNDELTKRAKKWLVENPDRTLGDVISLKDVK